MMHKCHNFLEKLTSEVVVVVVELFINKIHKPPAFIMNIVEMILSIESNYMHGFMFM